MIECPTNTTSNNYFGEGNGLIGISTDEGSPNATVTWDHPVTSGNGTVTVVSSPYESGDMIPIGTHTITFTATDSSGNIDICDFGLQVVDNEDPIIKNCPNDTTVNTTNGLPTATVSWIEPTATDNSGSTFVINTIKTRSMFPIGNSLVTYTAYDFPQFNTAICSFIVTVKDPESPDIINCPMDMTVNTTTGEAFTINVTWVEPTATDNSGETSVPVADYTPGDNMFPIGDTTVQYNVSDSYGNYNERCSFVITVEDNEDPIIKNCPNDTTVNTTNGLPTATVSWIEPTATDNSGFRLFINTITSESMFPIGDSLVTYTAVDLSQFNTAICSFIVTVKDPESPDIINCPMDMIVNTTTGEVFAINVTWVEPTATDNSGETPVPVADYTPGDNMFPIGDTTVQYNVSDSFGNYNERCSFVITVEDNERPMVECPKNITSSNYIGEDNGLVGVSTGKGSPNATVTWDPPLASDNSNETVTVVPSSYESGDMIPIGIHTITFTATDSSGNIGTCDFNIKIEDQEAPDIINCPMNMTVNTTTGEAFAINITWVEPTATDNSGEFIELESNYTSGNIMFPIGDTAVQYNFSDSSGNFNDSCVFVITVEGRKYVFLNSDVRALTIE
ncbi:hyalin-like [Antedon mediterranea]|uniref:hyalin-like n=1 Tax=Antedon mediterranea TaxID=105859 RepID=UPI003AF4A828